MHRRVEHPLLLAKQAVPPARRTAVARDRLHRRLRDNRDTPLTVVVGPAGTGKTTLLTQWAHDPAEPRRVVWVSLDAADAEPVRFWTYVLAALSEAAGILVCAARAAMSAPGLDPVDVALPTLLNDLSRADVELVLVLDDYQVIDNPRIHEGVEFLLTYLPPALRLIIASRVDPPLPLARMRARGDLTEIQATDLRFAVDEAAELLTSAGVVGLTTGDAARLCRRCEGWAAGLRLAATAAREGGAPAVAVTEIRGDDRHLLDYFRTEILARLRPDQRALLVRCSVLDRLSGALCDAVLGDVGTAALLAELDRSDLFVSRVDRDWYRCHALFRDALRRELITTEPDEERVLLVRAADWFLAHGFVEDAVHHLLAAGHTRPAADLLLESTRWFFDHGAAASFLQWGEQVARMLDPPDPRLLVMLVFAAGFSGRFDDVPRWLHAAEPLIRDDSPALSGWQSLRAGLLSRTATLGYHHRGDITAALADAARAAELETDPQLPGYAVARGSLGSMLLGAGRFAESAEVLARARSSPGWARLPAFYQLQASGVLGLSLLRLDRIADAGRLCAEIGPAVAAADAEWGHAAAAALTVPTTVAGSLARARGDLPTALDTLRRAADIARLWGLSSFLVLTLARLADAELAGGDRGRARELVDEAAETADSGPVFPVVRDELDDVAARAGRDAARTARRDGAMVEELTDRELAILRRLGGTGSQREIGASLFLSVNTVKGYTKSLYRKLDVGTRAAAVARARALDLIP